MDESIIKSLIAMGAPPDVIEAVKKKQAPKDDGFLVYEDNWESFLFFLDVSNQWNIAIGMSKPMYVSLNWTGIESVVRTFKPIPKAKRAQLYDDLRIIERAALEFINQ